VGIRRELDKLLNDSEAASLDVMQSNLASLADSLINKVMARELGLSKSNKLDAVKDVTASGINEYKRELLDLLTVIAYEALRLAKKEVPKAKFALSEIDYSNILFVESKRVKKLKSNAVKNKRIETMWKKLPAKVRKRLKIQQELLVKTQLSDLEKAIFFSYTSAVNQELTPEEIAKSLEENAEGFITGPSVRAGAPLTAHEAIGEARSAFFADPEVEKEIEAFEFVNNFPKDRTPICEQLNGTIFAKDDPNKFKFTPPLHFNCRSMIMPIIIGDLKGRKIGKLKISKENEKYLQFSEKLKNFPIQYERLTNPFWG
jgi:SPP1 gp7 family putative phage head morphogenesis protein